MRKLPIPHTAKWVAVCISSLFGSLIFQGCSDEPPSPYADLDAAFPEGRKEIVSVEERAQDQAYMAQVSENARKFSKVTAAAAEREARVNYLREETKQALKRRLGEEPPVDVLETALQKSPVYQEAVAARDAAKAEVEAQRDANMAFIRAKMVSEAERYDAMRAEADAKAREAGLPVRGAPSAPTSAK